MTEIMFNQNIMIPLQWHKGISGKWLTCMAVGLEKIGISMCDDANKH